MNPICFTMADPVYAELFCAVSKSPMFAVDYLIPKGVYTRELRSIKSSIGSIQIENDEGLRICCFCRVMFLSFKED